MQVLIVELKMVFVSSLSFQSPSPPEAWYTSTMHKNRLSRPDLRANAASNVKNRRFLLCTDGELDVALLRLRSHRLIS